MAPNSIDQANGRGLRAWLVAPVPSSPFQARMQQLSLKWWRLRANPAALFGLAIIVLIALTALFAPLIATHDIYAQDLTMRLQRPSAAHWFGTDELGRDIFSRLVFGARITLYVALLTAVIAAPLGLIVGQVDFSNLFINLSGQDYPSLAAARAAGAPVIAYGAFINVVINFIIVALAIFLLVKGMNQLRRQQAEEPAEPPEAPRQEVLLQEIRDILKARV